MASESLTASRALVSANCRASVIRESDRARLGVSAAICCAKTQTVEIATAEPMTLGEFLQVDCENQLQRFQKRIEGHAGESTERPDGLFSTAIELRLRLGPMDVRMLSPRKPF